MHQKMEEIIFFLNKGPGPHPQRNKFNVLISWELMATGHIGTAMCKRGEEQKRYRLATTYTQVAAGTEFQAWYQVLENGENFK